MKAQDTAPKSTSRKQQWKRQHPLEPEMVQVPAGRFWMGSERPALELAGIEWKEWFERETPCHSVFLPDYVIGKYLATNAEFARFVEGGGYTTRKYWIEAGWEAKEQQDWTWPRHWKDERFNNPSQPVVGVSWYTAMAYCNWLSETTGRSYRLPTEAEWEKAARGLDRRIYPWGNTWAEGRANTSETLAGRTTPVDAFPGGASPYGALDMCGNAWEWCTSLRREYPYRYDDGRENLEIGGPRTLRGGSWEIGRKDARCAFHGSLLPDGFGDNVGFRVALAF